MEITLTISKEDVMKEVATTTAYTGAKMDTDATAHDRISTVDEDESQLDRFWDECRSDLCQELIGMVTFEGETTGRVIGGTILPLATAATSEAAQAAIVTPHYELRLDVSKSFDSALLPSMKVSLFNYFVMGIAAKWYVYTNKQEAGDYADKAATLLDDIHRKAVYKKKPTRPTYDD
jgi:hypothetical protein